MAGVAPCGQQNSRNSSAATAALRHNNKGTGVSGVPGGETAMDLGLAGKRVLITGGSRGIGGGAARVFAGEGARLVLVARSADGLAAMRDRLVAEFGHTLDQTIETCATDLTDSAGIDALAARFPDIDILVNNAGAVPGGDLFQVDEARWRAGWDTKVFAYINMCRVFYPLMKARGGGVIVNIHGIGSRTKRWDYLCGGMGNAALDYFTETLGAGSPRDNIRVVGVLPGPVETERYASIMTARYGAQPWPPRPFDRAAAPDELGRAIAFLASSASSYTSGALLVVDGGISVAK